MKDPNSQIIQDLGSRYEQTHLRTPIIAAMLADGCRTLHKDDPLHAKKDAFRYIGDRLPQIWQLYADLRDACKDLDLDPSVFNPEGWNLLPRPSNVDLLDYWAPVLLEMLERPHISPDLSSILCMGLSRLYRGINQVKANSAFSLSQFFINLRKFSFPADGITTNPT